MRKVAKVAGVIALALFASACRGGDDDAATTTSIVDPAVTTSLLVSPGSDDAVGTIGAQESEGETTTSTTQVVGGTPTYEVAQRTEAELGDELVVVVEPGSYSEVELQNLVFDIVDRFQPVSAIVVDDPAAVALVGAEELSAEDAEFLAGHTFFTISDGVDVRFSGPYSQIADLTVGS